VTNAGFARSFTFHDAANNSLSFDELSAYNVDRVNPFLIDWPVSTHIQQLVTVLSFRSKHILIRFVFWQWFIGGKLKNTNMLATSVLGIQVNTEYDDEDEWQPSSHNFQVFPKKA
jgi:hypothetical protein